MRLRNHIAATAALVVAGAANALDFPDFTVDPDLTRRPPGRGWQHLDGARSHVVGLDLPRRSARILRI